MSGSKLISFFGFTLQGDLVVLFTAAVVWWILIGSLYTANGGKFRTILLYVPLSLVLGLIFARAMYWYCHTERYTSFLQIITDCSVTAFSLPGILIGAVLAAVITRPRQADETPGTVLLLDCAATAAMPALFVMRMSFLFNSACRGKLQIKNEALRRLPLCSTVTTSAGTIQYRFASFFVEGLLFLLLAFFVLKAFSKYGRKEKTTISPAPGKTGRIFLMLYSAAEILTDSTRYDAGFFSFNAFISMIQIIGALTLLGLMIRACFVDRHITKRKFGSALRLIPLWVMFLVGLGLAAYMEYLVQRHGNWYLRCYGGMIASLAIAIAAILITEKPAK